MAPAGGEPARRLAGTRRAERLLHALAQSPLATTLDLPPEHPNRPAIERAAHAYGLDERVRWAGDLAGWDAPERDLADIVEAAYGPGDEPAPLPTGDDSAFRGRRIGIVTNIPTHYRVPLFEAVSDRVTAAGGALRVFFLAPTYGRRAWMTTGPLRFDHRFLRSVGIRLGPERNPFVPRDLGRAVREFRPTLLVSAGHSLFVTGRLARGRTPVLVWTGETPQTRPPGRLGLAVRRDIARRSRGGIAYGIASAEALTQLAPGLPVVVARNTTAVPPRPGRPAAEEPVLLTVAELSSNRKGVDLLLEALAGLRDLPWRFTVAGGGPALEGLRDRATKLGLRERVTFAGAVAPERIAEHYAAADVFALASRRELFGLAVVEAMGAGLPTLVSGAVGAVPDLCADGRTALVVRPNTAAAWTAALRRVLSEPALRRELGAAAARTIARRWTLERSADAFVAGLRLGLEPDDDRRPRGVGPAAT